MKICIVCNEKFEDDDAIYNSTGDVACSYKCINKITTNQFTEHHHRQAFAERQFQHFLERARVAQLKAQLALAKGDHDAAQRWISIAENHLQFVDSCNETIDTHRRAIES